MASAYTHALLKQAKIHITLRLSTTSYWPPYDDDNSDAQAFDQSAQQQKLIISIGLMQR